MERKNIVKAVNTNKKNLEKKEKKTEQVSLDAQARLAEILTDSPRLVSLNGTEWEVSYCGGNNSRRRQYGVDIFSNI